MDSGMTAVGRGRPTSSLSRVYCKREVSFRRKKMHGLPSLRAIGAFRGNLRMSGFFMGGGVVMNHLPPPALPFGK